MFTALAHRGAIGARLVLLNDLPRQGEKIWKDIDVKMVFPGITL
jgi:hypothetical protein